ncbi:hypothetical protein GM708_03995 [Vibrio cholerae]|nr:hypothetical protein [Vibrio cholerae]
MASTGDHGTGRRAGGTRRPSAAVYRRRRLAVTVLALLVVAALAVGGAALAGLFGRGPDASAGGPTVAAATPGVPSEAPSEPGSVPSAAASSSPPGSAAASSGPTADPGPTAGGCATDVVLVAETDREAYAADEDPVLSLVVRNEGGEPCTVNVGTSQMEFVLTSDGERVFSSTDCQQASQDLERTVEPGGEERATFQWTRNRTVPGCTVVEESPGAGEYTLTTRLGARSSTPVGFTLR